jgi:hypothetical protein
VTEPTEPTESAPNSILDGTKKALGLGAEYDAFDSDIIMHINSVFFTLNQLGVGPKAGFAIEGAAETWDTFLGEDLNLNAVKSYVYLRVRLLFDPPQNSFGIASMEKQIEQMEWRLNVHVENVSEEIVEVVE